MTVAKPPVVSASEWKQSLTSLTAQEEAVAAALDDLTAARKRMPMTPLDAD